MGAVHVPLRDVTVRTATGATIATARHDPGGARDDTVVQRMIVGTGTDVTEIDRIQDAVTRYGDRFLQRIYTDAELRYCQRKRSAAESLAARFAAKEAGAKALGTGIAKGVSWREIEVTHLPGGRPALILHGRAAERAAMLGVRASHLSLSHGRDVAIATVILED